MANAVQISENTKDGGSLHAVRVGDLRVMVICDGEAEWYAQGLEIDYLAQGDSEVAVRKSFSRGLRATIKEHIKLYGHIKNLLRPADPNVWTEFYDHATGLAFSHSQITFLAFETPGEEHSFVATTAARKSPRKTKAKPKAAAPASERYAATQLPFNRITFIQACA